MLITGAARAESPRTRPMFAIFDPIMVPVAICTSFVAAETRETMNSGRDVDAATSVIPMTRLDTPSFLEISAACFVTISEPFISSTKPAINTVM